MESNPPVTSLIEIIWKFIRGDLSTADFESRVYSDPALENLLGEKLYLEVISTRFDSRYVVFDLKKTLSEFLISSTKPSCACPQVSDLAVVDMGEQSNQVFSTLDRIKERGDPCWWLSAYRCSECQQAWLVGQDETNDVFCLYRLDAHTMKALLEKNHWPPIFDQYEDLLRIGVEARKRVSFLTW